MPGRGSLSNPQPCFLRHNHNESFALHGHAPRVTLPHRLIRLIVVAMPIKILFVDDSEVIRFLYGKALERDSELSIVGMAGDGEGAIRKARELQPDVILLDIEMPRMDGLTALPRLRDVSPKSAIFVLSAVDQHYANLAVDALAMGAIECLVKPGAEGAEAIQTFHEELRGKIKEVIKYRKRVEEGHSEIRKQALLAGDARIPVLAKLNHAPRKTKLHPRPQLLAKPEEAPASCVQEMPARLRARSHHAIKAIVIASSTGGPEALIALLSKLKGQLAYMPIFITQHMPPVFTTALAKHLAHYGERSCKEAEDGEDVEPGMVYVAPGDQHLIIRKHGSKIVTHLTKDNPVNSCRPAADPMFASASNVYGPQLLAVVLTGIGNDGTQGARVVVEQGGAVIAQDKASSVVYGMPRSVAEAGLCESILPLADLPAEILKRCHR